MTRERPAQVDLRVALHLLGERGVIEQKRVHTAARLGVADLVAQPHPHVDRLELEHLERAPGDQRDRRQNAGDEQTEDVGSSAVHDLRLLKRIAARQAYEAGPWHASTSLRRSFGLPFPCHENGSNAMAVPDMSSARASARRRK